jgi:hypothetical protein
MLGGEIDLISAFDQAPLARGFANGTRLSRERSVSSLEAEACPPDVICEQMEAAPLVGGKTRE